MAGIANIDEEQGHHQHLGFEKEKAMKRQRDPKFMEIVKRLEELRDHADEMKRGMRMVTNGLLGAEINAEADGQGEGITDTSSFCDHTLHLIECTRNELSETHEQINRISRELEN